MGLSKIVTQLSQLGAENIAASPTGDSLIRYDSASGVWVDESGALLDASGNLTVESLITGVLTVDDVGGNAVLSTSSGFISLQPSNGIVEWTASGNVAQLLPATDADEMRLQGSNTADSGGRISMFGSSHASFPGSARLDYGDFTGAIPAAAKLFVRRLDNSASPTVFTIENDSGVSITPSEAAADALHITGSAGHTGDLFKITNDAAENRVVINAEGLLTTPALASSVVHLGGFGLNDPNNTYANAVIIGDPSSSQAAGNVDGGVYIGTRMDITGGPDGVLIGDSITHGNGVNNPTVVGNSNATTSGAADFPTILGEGWSVSQRNVILLGRPPGGDTVSTARLFCAAEVETIRWHAQADTAPPTLTHYMGVDASGADVAGSDGFLRAGAGTGTGAGGHLKFQTAAPGGTGSALNAFATVFEIGDDPSIGFFGNTPIAQPTTGHAEAAFVENAGGTAVNDDSTFGGYTLRQAVQALLDYGILG